MNNLMLSDTVRAAAMLKAVGRAINIEPGNFLKFLDILEKIDRYKFTAQRARGKLFFILCESKTAHFFLLVSMIISRSTHHRSANCVS